MPEYSVRGRGPVTLTKAHFKAQGGEGSVYVKDGTAYKVYADPKKMIPQGKLDELAKISDPRVLRPLGVLLDKAGVPVGFSMTALADAHPLCKLFPPKFRQRHQVGPEQVLRVVRRLQAVVKSVHAAGVLVVDLNELNFLVDAAFEEVYAIDVDSYQTPHYPATALMLSVQDHHCGGKWSEHSDHFSLGVLVFCLFTGLHPFKGEHPKYHPQAGDPPGALMARRMKDHASAFDPKVKLPPGFSLDDIPDEYEGWLRALFVEGKREAPPDGATKSTKKLQIAQTPAAPGRHFEVTKVHSYGSEILDYLGIGEGFAFVSGQGLVVGGRPVFPHAGPTLLHVGLTPKLGRIVVAYLQGTQIRLWGAAAAALIPCAVEAHDLMSIDGRLYARSNDQVVEVVLAEVGARLLAHAQVVAQVLPQATKLFRGVAIQSIFGSAFASLFAASGRCHQHRVPELDGHEVLDARLERNVLVVSAVHRASGRHDQLVLRFSKDFDAYDARILEDVASDEVNFAVTDAGALVRMTDRGEVEVSYAKKGDPRLMNYLDPQVGPDCALYSDGARVLMARGRVLSQISFKKTS